MTPIANPFTPHTPIDPEYFAGRIHEVDKVSSALNQTRHRKTQHLLLTGERGIGKTSLALYAQYLAKQPSLFLKTDFQFATSYYLIERNQTLSDLCRGLTSRLLDSIGRGLAQRCFDKLKQLNLHFSIHVTGLGDVGAATAREEESQFRLYTDFIKAVEQSWDEIKETHNGVVLIVDELHNLASPGTAGSFFKVVSETWVVDGYRQLMFMGVGLPQISALISEDDPSAPRLFSYVELSRMTEEECLAILQRCLQDTGKRIDDKAAAGIAKRSGGFPYFLHQLGYDAFNVDTDGLIDEKDVNGGLILSLVQFGRMFFGRMYKSVEGTHKQKIVDELARGINMPLTASELDSKLRIKNIHQYLVKLEKDGIVERVDNKFRLSSDLLAIYVLLFKTAPKTVLQEARRQA